MQQSSTGGRTDQAREMDGPLGVRRDGGRVADRERWGSSRPAGRLPAAVAVPVGPAEASVSSRPPARGLNYDLRR